MGKLIRSDAVAAAVGAMGADALAAARAQAGGATDTAPGASAEGAGSTDSAASAEPATPAEPVAPAASAEPAEAATPAAPAASAESAAPAKPAAFAAPAASAESGVPAAPAAPVAPAASAESGVPAAPAAPVAPAASAESGVPAAPAASAAPAAPVVTFGPAKGGRSRGPQSAQLPGRASGAESAAAKPVWEPDPNEVFDVIIIGAGPAGLSAGLNLVRARRRVLMLDSNRPRHSATLKSHGFLTRDGVSPLELRRLGREEFEHYPEASFHQGLVTGIDRVEEPAPAATAVAASAPVAPAASAPPGGELFVVHAKGIRGSGDRSATARTVLIATGLTETLPALPSIRAYYGTDLHSCTECDGYEKSDAPLALIGETSDLAERALLLSQWSNDLIVFTNGTAELSKHDESALDARGIGVERRPIADIEGDRGGMTGVSLVDGTVILRSGGFVRPVWTTALDYSGMLGVETDADNLLVTDPLGRTSVPGVFAAGDSTPPGAQQLVVAAGEGAKVASAINRHLIGLL